MRPFEHFTVRTTEEAIELLGRFDGKARLIAGGTALIPALKADIFPNYPKALINIKEIGDLQFIRAGKEGLRIGTLTKLEEIAESQSVKKDYPILQKAALSVGTPQVRRMGTVGGNICQEPRCWYYWYPHQIGGRIVCYLKGGRHCYALTGENQYHSIFGCYREANRPVACVEACPASTDVPSILEKLKGKDLQEAARILLDVNPIPAVTGRVCPHFCESECSRNGFDEAVSIRDAERFIGDYILGNLGTFYLPPSKKTGKTVAIVGSGPAGLVAAYCLRRRGHEVTIFEKEAEAGGLLRYGIPPFRLPKNVVESIVRALEERLGVEFRFNLNVGRDMSLEELSSKFDALLLATGAWKEGLMGIPGEELMQSGLEFLKSINSGKKGVDWKKVAVVGGGNVAIDVARVLVRLGTRPEILYRRTEAEMPALKEEVERAKEEGVGFEFLTQPIAVEKRDGEIRLKCTRMELGAPDSSGRPVPMPVAGSEFEVGYDAVIKAVGEGPDLSFLPAEFLDKAGRLKIETSFFVGKNIFAAGDFVTGPSTVIEAVAAGRKVANSINRFLSGEEASPLERSTLIRVNASALTRKERIAVSTPSEMGLQVEESPNLDLEEVTKEADRCFNCGCVAVSPSDMAVALMALNGRIRVVGSRGTRIVPAEEFFTLLGGGLAHDEVVTEIEIPKPSERERQVFLKFRLRSSLDFPIVSVGIVAEMEEDLCREARIVLGGVAPIPIKAKEAEQMIMGKRIEESIVEEVAQRAVSGAIPLGKNGYKVEITRTMLRRALLSLRGK